MMHLSVAAYLILFSAALATAQHNPQTDSPNPTPSPNFKVPGTIYPTGSGGSPPKEETKAPDYEAMALSMAKSIGFQETKCKPGGFVEVPPGLDPNKNYAFNNLRIEDLKCPKLVQVSCPDLGNAGSKFAVDCQVWNDLGSGKVLSLKCYPDGCLVQGVMEVSK